MVNVVRLREQLEFVTRNSKHHKQGVWLERTGKSACGTFGCLAGWTAYNYAFDRLVPTVITHSGGCLIEYNPPDGDWYALGAELLDLDLDTAESLFDSDNTLWDLWNIANIITDGAIEIPAEVENNRDPDLDRSIDWDEYYV